MSEKKKSQTYLFAYEAMPSVFRSSIDKFLELIEEDGMEFLEFWWNHIAEKYDLGEEELVPIDGLKFEVRKEEKVATVVLLTLPLPRKHGEPYFLALVHPHQIHTFLKWKNEPRVFTLSYKKVEDGNPQETIFGEWTPRLRFFPAKINLNPDLETFYQTVLSNMGKK
jgi:hypothetical protein